jgi:hyperosmotically inducible periplasmic protein
MPRCLRVLASALGLGAWLGLAGLTGCALNHRPQTTGQPGDGPGAAAPRESQAVDQHIHDSRTAERVREVLAASAPYKFDEVRVAASQGVVSLSGGVNTNAQRTTAGALARRVAGVKSVENRLIVRD